MMSKSHIEDHTRKLSEDFFSQFYGSLLLYAFSHIALISSLSQARVSFELSWNQS